MANNRLILQELIRRLSYKERGYLDTQLHEDKIAGGFLYSHLFKEQKEFVDDTSPLVTACCSRRAGKSFAIGAKMVRVARERKGARIVYICPTKDMAKEIMWDKILKLMNRQYDLKMKFDEVRLLAKFPNGSYIRLLGADKASDIGKIRGIALDLAVLDEAQNFRKHIEAFVEEDLGPTLADYDGQLFVTGTPRRMRSGFFYEISTGRRKGWSHHNWTVLENRAYPAILRYFKKLGIDKDTLDDEQWYNLAKAWRQQMWDARGIDESMGKVQREWMGLWVEDESNLVYPYRPEVNDIDRLPKADGGWTYGLGLDLGIMALSVVAWNRHDPNLYVVSSEKHAWTIDQMGERAVELRDDYKITKIVADCGALGKHIVEDLRSRFGLSVEPADKIQKKAFQAVFASELRRGLIRLLPNTGPLKTEYRELQYNDAGDEDPHGKKDCADATLYIWRKSRHYKARPRAASEIEYETMTPGRKFEVDMEKNLEKRQRRREREERKRNRNGRGVTMTQLRGIL